MPNEAMLGKIEKSFTSSKSVRVDERHKLVTVVCQLE
jgi:hypothetical protein